MSWWQAITGSGEEDIYKRLSESAKQAGQIYGQYAEQERGALSQAEQQALNEMQGYYQQALGFGAPYRQAGGQALEAYKASLGLPSTMKYQDVLDMFHESPGYKFALQQGTTARKAAAAMGGTALSGGLLKELTSYGTGMAEQEFGSYQNRLAGLTTMGQQMASQAASEAMSTGQLTSGISQQMGSEYAQTYGMQGQVSANALMAAAEARARGEEESLSSKRGLLGDLAKLGGLFGGYELGMFGKGAGALGGFGSAAGAGGGISNAVARSGVFDIFG